MEPKYFWVIKIELFEFIITKYTHLLKTNNLWPQGLQKEALQQRYSPCKFEKPNIKGEIKNNFQKNPNIHTKKSFLSDLVKNKFKLNIFGMDFMTNQLWLFQRNVGYNLERA